MPTQIYRSALLRFADDGSPLYDSDGLLADLGRQVKMEPVEWHEPATF